MGVAEGEIQRVRAATDLVALISEKTMLKKQGSRFVGLCPFHDERSPSFSVNLASGGMYYCFGCRAKGDAITFVRETLHLEFIEALRYLAERAGLQLQEDEQPSGPRQDRKAFFDAMERAVEWYHQRLLTAPDAGPARNYLRSRGYDSDTVRQFKLGWAPDEWDALTSELRLSREVLEGTGLGFVNRRDRTQDFLRARIVFPIFDVAGRAIAVGGRVLPPGPGPADPAARPEPKYKNSPETAIYSKRRTLYALNWAKDDIVKSEEIIVCEGYTDVIAFFRAGLPRAVATCGTALAEEHFRTLKNFARRIVLAYDGDFAGQSAAASVYQWEKDHEVEVAVAQFPAGMDPAEFAASDPSGLAAAVAAAMPFLEFRLRRVLDGARLQTAEGRARAAEEAVRVLAEHPNALVRDQYVQDVADRLRLDPDRLRPMVEQAVRSGGRARVAVGEVAVPRPTIDRTSFRPGVEALRLLINEPDRIDGRLVPAYFGEPLQRAAFEALESGEMLTTVLDQLEARGDTETAELLRLLAAELEPENVLSDDELNSLVAQLIRPAVNRALEGVSRAMRSGEVAPDEALEVIRAIRETLEALDGEGHLAAEVALREWLVDHDTEFG
jgi:DNA primase